MAVLAPRSSVDDAPAPLPLPVFASATPLSPRPHTTSSIHELLDAKHCPQPSILYPNHGFARGGVGHLVSTGNARGSLNRLPQTNKTFLSHSRSTSAAATPLNSRPSTVYSSHANSPPHTRRVHGPDADAGLPPSPHHHRTTITAQGERSAPPPAPAASAAATAAAVQQHVQLALGAPLTAPLPSYAAPLRGSLAPKRRMNEARPSTTMSATGGALLQNTLPPPALLGACKAWERDVPHPSDFTAATRSTRIHDVPAASKWSSISFYETDPGEIRRHIDIMNALDQVHADGIMAEQRTLDLKHQAWAQRQRQTFMRQRQEKAMNYAQSGLPVRPTYFVNSGGMSSGEEVGGDGWGEEAAGGDGGALRPHTVHSAVSYQSRWGNGLEEGGEWGPRVRALTASGTISLPKPSFGKIYDRMGAEINDSPRLAEFAWRQKRAAAKASKEAREIAQQMQELEDFEGHLSYIRRQQGRSRYNTIGSEEAAA